MYWNFGILTCGSDEKIPVKCVQGQSPRTANSHHSLENDKENYIFCDKITQHFHLLIKTIINLKNVISTKVTLIRLPPNFPATISWLKMNKHIFGSHF